MVPSQSKADAWSRDHTFGLIDRFPIDVTADVVILLASALATKVGWFTDFDVVPADRLPGPWGDRLKPGMKAIAISRDLIPKGLTHDTEVTIEGLDGTYRVLDKMNRRWARKIDIFMGHDRPRASRAKRWMSGPYRSPPTAGARTTNPAPSHGTQGFGGCPVVAA